MDTEKHIEHLANLRHAIKSVLGEYINEVERVEGNTDTLNDSVILAATMAVMCEFIHEAGREMDDTMLNQLKAVFSAVVLADQLSKALDNAGGVEKMVAPTSTIQ